MTRPEPRAGGAGDQAPSHRLGPVVVKFAAVGVLNTAVHVMTTVLLVEMLHVNPVPASVVGFVFAVTVSFLLNTYWTFRRSDNLSRRFLRFLLVSVSAMLLNTLIMYAAVDVYAIHYLIGLALVLLIVPAYNFVLNYFWSFRSD